MLYSVGQLKICQITLMRYIVCSVKAGNWVSWAVVVYRVLRPHKYIFRLTPERYQGQKNKGVYPWYICKYHCSSCYVCV